MPLGRELLIDAGVEVVVVVGVCAHGRVVGCRGCAARCRVVAKDLLRDQGAGGGETARRDHVVLKLVADVVATRVLVNGQGIVDVHARG